MTEAKGRQRSVSMSQRDIDELTTEARRLGRSKSWLIQRAWKIARDEIRRTDRV